MCHLSLRTSDFMPQTAARGTSVKPRDHNSGPANTSDGMHLGYTLK
jgi:hypothetical protein